jgi:hypothetical protein
MAGGFFCGDDIPQRLKTLMEEHYIGPEIDFFPSPHVALQNYRTDPPAWLLERRDSDPVPPKKFLRSRLIFYPGSGTDAHPIEVFGNSGTAYCFILVDYLPIDRRKSELDLENSMLQIGYTPIHIQTIPISALWPIAWERHFYPNKDELAALECFSAGTDSFAWFGIWANRHRPFHRVATLYMRHEAHEVYDRLFCQRGQKAPFGILLQDHGLGGSWTSFASACSHLAGMTLASGLPKFLLAGEPGFLWNGYRPISSTTSGGMHRLSRRLHRRIQWRRLRSPQEI